MQLRILSRGKKHPQCQPVNKAKLLIGRGQLVTTYDNTYRYGTVDAWVGSESNDRRHDIEVWLYSAAHVMFLLLIGWIACRLSGSLYETEIK